MTNLSYKERFAKKLTTLALMLDHDLSKDKMAAYWEYFSSMDLDPNDVLNAIQQAASTCKFFPKPAELIELITGGKGGGQNATVAWQTVLRNMELHGPYQSVEFEDGAIAAAIAGLGGWSSLCELSYEDLTMQRIPARFEALYTEAVRNGHHKQSGSLEGITESENRANGFEIVNPESSKALNTKEIIDRAKKKSDIKLIASTPGPTEEIPEKCQEAIKRLNNKTRLN